MTSLMGVAFYNQSNGSERTVALTEVVGDGSDSVLYSSSAKQIFLPLKQLSDQTDFLVTLRDSFFANPVMQIDTTYSWVVDENNDSTQVMTIDTSTVIPPVQCRLSVQHNTVPQYISPECGCGVAHQLSSVVFGNDTLSCTVEIINSNITTSDGEIHIQIYW
ncbi:MAG: hypothetical protein J5808_04605 [Paludibacteraceae bacterium]|nr:hypothetical protein [Paludibacteraceae bacterium]